MTTDQIRGNSKAAVRPIMTLLEVLQTEVDEISLQTTTEAGNTTDQDIEITDAAKGFIMTAPDLTRWRVTIENDGTLTSTDLTPP